MSSEQISVLSDERLQSLAGALWSRESPSCQTALISLLLGQQNLDSSGYRIEDFSSESIENLYPDPSEWSIDKCIAWLDERDAVDYSDLEKDDPEQFRDEVRDYSDPKEILEWWAISSEFANKLREHGECILDNDYGIWWGRTCSGQSVTLDSVIQSIAVDALS